MRALSQVAEGLDEWVMDRLDSERAVFSLSGAKQLHYDMQVARPSHPQERQRGHRNQ